MAATAQAMQNAQPTWQQAIGQAERKFTEIARATGVDLHFQKEAMFAMQIIGAKDFVAKAAANNPVSLRDAVVNVASVGLSLNPALKLAYLVPRDGAICLDISYQGLLKIATDTGSIMWAMAELVYSSDTFIWHGWDRSPEHTFDPFAADAERGELRGAYCVAKLHDGTILVDRMKAEKIYKVRNASKAYNRYEGGKHKPSGPWVDYFDDMVKKAMLKQSYKIWPKTDRLKEAMHIINEHEGIDFEAPRDEPKASPGLPLYPSDKFAAELPKWTAVMRSGQLTADAIIATLSSSYTITDQQKEQIRNAGAIEGEQ